MRLLAVYGMLLGFIGQLSYGIATQFLGKEIDSLYMLLSVIVMLLGGILWQASSRPPKK
jgi:hypothetical protein